jgi:hypothetical protein
LCQAFSSWRIRDYLLFIIFLLTPHPLKFIKVTLPFIPLP